MNAWKYIFVDDCSHTFQDCIQWREIKFFAWNPRAVYILPWNRKRWSRHLHCSSKWWPATLDRLSIITGIIQTDTMLTVRCLNESRHFRSHRAVAFFVVIFLHDNLLILKRNVNNQIYSTLYSIADSTDTFVPLRPLSASRKAGFGMMRRINGLIQADSAGSVFRVIDEPKHIRAGGNLLIT